MKTAPRLLALLLLAAAFASPHLALAQAVEPTINIPSLEVHIPGVDQALTDPIKVDCSSEFSSIDAVQCLAFPWIGEYISSLYVFAVYAATIAAAIVIMVAGFLWVTAGGNTNQIGTARSYIAGAILGLSLMLGSYTILRLVNPELVQFTALSIPILKRVDLAEVSQAITGSTVPILINCSQGTITTNISGQFDTTFNQMGQQYGLDPFLLLAITKTENASFNPALSNQQGLTAAYGLMQMLPATAKDVIARDADLRGKTPASCQQPYVNPNYVKNPSSPDKATPYWLYQTDCKTFLAQHPDVEIQMGASYLQYIRVVLAAQDPAAANDLALVSGAYLEGEGNGVKMVQGLANPAVEAAAHNYFVKVNANYRSFCPASPPPSSSPDATPLPPPQ